MYRHRLPHPLLWEGHVYLYSGLKGAKPTQGSHTAPIPVPSLSLGVSPQKAAAVMDSATDPSNYPESPTEEDEIFLCKGCGEVRMADDSRRDHGA